MRPGTLRFEDNLNDIERVAYLLKIASVASDLVTSICGQFIGAGQYRSVFEYNLDDRYVVKIEPRNTLCNIVEYQLWYEIEYLRNDMAWVKDWFAPVRWISPNGKILVMQKTHNLPGKKKNPEKKTHPCIVPFEKLPKEQQTKDVLFMAVVRSFDELYKALNS